MRQLAGPSTIAPPVASTQALPPAGLTELHARELDLQLRVTDLALRVGQLREQRDQASGVDRARLDRAWADMQRDLTRASLELDAARGQIGRLERAQEWQIANTVQPPPADRFPDSERLAMGGTFLLMIPIVIALTRRLWVRGGRRATELDLESSPRLQRIEQAVESIAIEVERIGEAQRFTTKLMAERQADPVANRLAASPARREPGTITPH